MKQIKKTFTNPHIYEIVEDGFIYDPMRADGILFIALVVNPKNAALHFDIVEAIKNKSYIADISIQWFLKKINKREKIYLHIVFKKPFLYDFLVEFDCMNDITVVDAIIQNSGVYIGYGKKGDFVSEIGREKLFFYEVNMSEEQISDWDKIHKSILYKKFKKEGYLKKQIPNKIDEWIKSFGRFQNQQIRGRMTENSYNQLAESGFLNKTEIPLVPAEGFDKMCEEWSQLYRENREEWLQLGCKKNNT